MKFFIDTNSFEVGKQQDAPAIQGLAVLITDDGWRQPAIHLVIAANGHANAFEADLRAHVTFAVANSRHARKEDAARKAEEDADPHRDQAEAFHPQSPTLSPSFAARCFPLSLGFAGET